jgi:hypothetical protein
MQWIWNEEPTALRNERYLEWGIVERCQQTPVKFKVICGFCRSSDVDLAPTNTHLKCNNCHMEEIVK